LTDKEIFVSLLFVRKTMTRRCDQMKSPFSICLFDDNGFFLSVAGENNKQPYLSIGMKDGQKIAGVYNSSNNDATDQLLLELADKNLDAARWLLNKKLLLANPKKTIPALVKANIIKGTIIEADGEDQIVVYQYTPETKEILAHYKWEKSKRSTTLFFYIED